MDIFEAIKAKSRRFIPFEVEIEGDKFKLYVRRASSGDAQAMTLAWESAYKKAREEYRETDEETTSLYAIIERQNEKALAHFIAEAEEDDFKAQASTLSDDVPCDDEHPEVKELAETLQKEREEFLATQPHEELVRLAMERRAHFNAMREGNAAQNRAMASMVIYADKLDEAGNPTGEKVPLFESPEKVEEYPMGTIVAILKASREALEKETAQVPLT